MSDEIPYSPPRRELPEAPKNFSILLIGVMICIIGALLINQGINVAKDVGPRILLSMALLAAGAMLILAGASRIWPKNQAVDIALIVTGVLCIMASGALIAENPGGTAYAIVLTLIGIALIVAGVKVFAQAWRKFRR